MSEDRPVLQFGWLKEGWYEVGQLIEFEPIEVGPDHPDYDSYKKFYDEQQRRITS